MRKGQSIIEVIASLSVLVVGMLGILTLLGQSFFLARTTNDEAVATYLAAEGIEVAKNLIDHDVYLYLASIGTGWGTCFGAGGDFELDQTTTNCAALHTYSAATPDLLQYNPTSKRYIYAFNDAVGGASPTTFSRRVRVTPIGANEIVVQSVVSWTVRGAAHNVNLEDHFYNWQPAP